MSDEDHGWNEVSGRQRIAPEIRFHAKLSMPVPPSASSLEPAVLGLHDGNPAPLRGTPAGDRRLVSVDVEQIDPVLANDSRQPRDLAHVIFSAADQFQRNTSLANGMREWTVMKQH